MTNDIVASKRCIICNPKNDTLYYHNSEDDGMIWMWCNKCNRAYSIYEYTATAGISLSDFLKQKFDFVVNKGNEVQKMEWPRNFIPLFDKRAKSAIDYLQSRGLDIDDGMYYDVFRNGIVFPYFYDSYFVGAQTRFITPRIDVDGHVQKIDTMPGTRLGLLFYNWNSTFIPPQVRGIIITEGAFNCKSIEQSLNRLYGSMLKNPWKCIAASGSGASQHQRDLMKDLKDKGYKVIVAPDADEAGVHMFEKFSKSDSATHYAFPEKDGEDWNDVMKSMGKDSFSRYFISRIIPILG